MKPNIRDWCGFQYRRAGNRFAAFQKPITPSIRPVQEYQRNAQKGRLTER